MTRFLFCPVSERGDIAPTVPLALELVSRGHDIVYLIDTCFEQELNDEGLRSITTAGGICGPERRSARVGPFAGVDGQLESFGRVCDAFGPDIVVDGTYPFAHRLVCERRNIPRASIFTGCFPIPTTDIFFPHGPGIPPPSDERGRSLARLATLIQDAREEDDLIAWNTARRRCGLPLACVHPWRDEASRHLVLLATSPMFEYPRSDLPPQYWFTGPLIWQPSGVALPERVNRLGPTPPIVYVTQGATYTGNPIIVKLACAALASEPVQVVATVGREFTPSEFCPTPGHVIIERYVPLSHLVDRVAAVVTHGGAGAVQTALSHGIPLVILPFTADQFEVAARCEWTGVGVRLDPWTSTAENLRDAVRTILSDPTYRANASQIAAGCRRYRGAEDGADLLDRLAETREPVLRPKLHRNPWCEEVP